MRSLLRLLTVIVVLFMCAEALTFKELAEQLESGDPYQVTKATKWIRYKFTSNGEYKRFQSQLESSVEYKESSKLREVLEKEVKRAKVNEYAQKYADMLESGDPAKIKETVSTFEMAQAKADWSPLTVYFVKKSPAYKKSAELRKLVDRLYPFLHIESQKGIDYSLTFIKTLFETKDPEIVMDQRQSIQQAAKSTIVTKHVANMIINSEVYQKSAIIQKEVWPLIEADVFKGVAYWVKGLDDGNEARGWIEDAKEKGLLKPYTVQMIRQSNYYTQSKQFRKLFDHVLSEPSISDKLLKDELQKVADMLESGDADKMARATNKILESHVKGKFTHELSMRIMNSAVYLKSKVLRDAFQKATMGPTHQQVNEGMKMIAGLLEDGHILKVKQHFDEAQSRGELTPFNINMIKKTPAYQMSDKLRSLLSHYFGTKSKMVGVSLKGGEGQDPQTMAVPHKKADGLDPDNL